MTRETRHLSVWIDCPASKVYEYASDPVNIPEWAPGLGKAVEEIDGRWFVVTSEGRVGLSFASRNEFGVLDHDVVMPSGETIYNPMRVTVYDSGCEVVFSLRRLPGLSNEDFARDAATVLADLNRLKSVIESTK